MNKNTRDISISLQALAVIIFGVRYAIMRERLRRADLHAWYQQQNATEFGGQLQDASVQRSSSTDTQTRQRAKLATL